MKDDVLTMLDDIDLKELSLVYDTHDVFLTAYFPVTKRELDLFLPFFERRISAMEKALEPGTLLDNLRKTVSIVEPWLSRKPIKGEQSRAIFASASKDFLDIYRLPLPVEKAVILDTSPFIKPLALLRDDHYNYGIVLLDSHRACLISVSTGTITEESCMSKDIMNKHKKGGQSQMRFQRLRKGAIQQFLSQVAEDVEKTFYKETTKYWRGLLIAGPGTTKKELKEILPHHLQQDVIDMVDMEYEVNRGKLLEQTEALAMEDEASQGHERVQALMGAVFRGEGAVYGAEEVTNAVKNGRVAVLILQREKSLPGFICESCQLLFDTVPPDHKCKYCNTDLSQVDMVEEILEFAERTDAEVEFVQDEPFLEKVGGIAALLRY